VAILLSLTFPFNSISFRTAPEFPKTKTIIKEQSVTEASANTNIIVPVITGHKAANFNALFYLKAIYLGVLIVLLIRISLGILKFLFILYKSKPQHFHDKIIYLSPKIPGSTAFFGILFLNPNLREHPHLSKIISHENIHASQYHTLDVLLIELLAAAMWFNPFVWFLRRSLQQLHEYLADEGVINSGYDRLEYQKLLVNHIAEETLLLSSGFQSSIKKRIIMITKHKTPHGMERKFLAILPMAAGILITISCMNSPNASEKTDKTPKDTNKAKVVEQPANTPLETVSGTNSKSMIAAIGLTKMNVIYLGVDNPVDIAVSGVSADNVRPSITNGSIIRVGKGYIIRPRTLGYTIVAVEALINGKWENVTSMEFRVKRVPDPVAKVDGKKGGIIDKNLLASQNIVQADIEYFDFDLHFAITGFTVSTNENGLTREEISTTDKLTSAQQDMIKNAVKGQKIYFEKINSMGPDGTIRALPSIMFEIE